MTKIKNKIVEVSKMKQDLMDEKFENEESVEILAEATLTFEENMLSGDADECSRYGCTCINYEKCCGCLLQ